MGRWKSKELRGAPSPQPWKLDLSGQLDLFDEFDVGDDPTDEYHITEPDDYMKRFEEDDTLVFKREKDE